jgi:nicotinamidase-related amidase
MDIERRTAGNTAIVLIDYVTGFAPMIRSQTVAENAAGGRALLQTANTFGVPLVVSVGPRNDPRGALYPEIAKVVGEHPVVHRGLSFDAFDDEGFTSAVAALGRKHLVVAGLMTDGCVMHTVLSALRAGYEVSVIVDATASESAAAHSAALARFTQTGRGAAKLAVARLRAPAFLRERRHAAGISRDSVKFGGLRHAQLDAGERGRGHRGQPGKQYRRMSP